MARRRSGLFYIRFQEVISHVQEHKRKQAFSGFLAFSIKKEISDRLKILFPFFVPAAAQYVFAAEKKKPQTVRVYRLSVVFSNLL